MFFPGPWPGPKWVYLGAGAVTVTLIGAGMLFGATVGDALFALAVCVVLIVAAPKTIERLGGPDALGRRNTKP